MVALILITQLKTLKCFISPQQVGIRANSGVGWRPLLSSSTL